MQMAYILVPLLLLAVRDAHDACLWLKAAGFPQYVQMFEGKQTYRHNYDKHTLAGRHSHDMAFFFLHRRSVSHQPFEVSSGKGSLLSRTICLGRTHQVRTCI